MTYLNNTLTMVYEKLSKLEIPIAYFYFDKTERVEAPFIIIRETKNFVSADGDIYYGTYYFNIEFYHRGDMELVDKFRDIIHDIKPIVNYEQTPLDGVILLRTTFELYEELETKEIEINGEQSNV